MTLFATPWQAASTLGQSLRVPSPYVQEQTLCPSNLHTIPAGKHQHIEQLHAQSTRSLETHRILECQDAEPPAHMVTY